MKFLRPLLPLLALTALLLPSLATAAVPQYVTYSGRVLDEFGEAVEGEVVLSVGIFKEVTDATDVNGLGDPSWTDDFTTIIINGYFSIVLGSSAVLTAADLTGDDVWVALSIDSGPWMVPASQLTSAPFALQAENADVAAFADTAGQVDGPVNATTVTVDGTEVIDNTGAWTGPIETTSAARVGSLWVDGVLIIDNNNWVGPAPDLPAGTAIDGEAVLTGTDLETQIDTQITTFVGSEQDSNPLNHERYAGKDELLMEIENVGSVSALPSYADEYLYHAPTTATDVATDLQSEFVSLSGDTMTGDLVVEGLVQTKGINDENDPTAVTPGTVGFSLAPDPNGTGTTEIDTWEIEADETSFVVKDFQGSATEYLVIEESSTGVGLISLQPEGNASMAVGASSVDFAPAGASGSAVTTVATLTQDTANLVNTSVGPSLQVSEGSVSAPLNSGTSVLDLTQTGVSIGASGVPTTVLGDLSVQGNVNLTSQAIQGTLTVEADNSADGLELDVGTDGVDITGDLTVTGTSALADTNVTGTVTVTGDTTQTGDITINNGSRDIISLAGALADFTIPLSVDADNNNVDELAVTNGAVQINAGFNVNDTTDSTTELTVADAGVTVRDSLTVATGGLGVTAGGINVSAGGLQVADGNFTVTANGDGVTEVAIDDTGMDITGDLDVSGTITGNISGSISTTAITASSGNLTVTADGDGATELAVTDAGVTVADGLTLASGDLGVTTGNLTVTAGTVSSTGVDVTGALTVTGGNLVVGTTSDAVASIDATDSAVLINEPTTIADGGLTVTNTGIDVTAGGLDVTAGGISVTAGGLDVADGNLVVTTDGDSTVAMTINDTDVTIAEGLDVTAGGVDVTAGGVTVTAGGIDINGGGLTVDSGGLSVASAGSGILDVNTSAELQETDIDGNLTVTAASAPTVGSTTASGTVVAYQYLRVGCPSGYTGITGTNNQACISSARSAQTYVNAAIDCYDEGAHLCSQSEYLVADQQQSNFLDTSGNEFWSCDGKPDGSNDNDADEMGYYQVRGSDTNDDFEFDLVLDNNPPTKAYHCCIFP